MSPHLTRPVEGCGLVGICLIGASTRGDANASIGDIKLEVAERNEGGGGLQAFCISNGIIFGHTQRLWLQRTQKNVATPESGRIRNELTGSVKRTAKNVAPER